MLVSWLPYAREGGEDVNIAKMPLINGCCHSSNESAFIPR